MKLPQLPKNSANFCKRAAAASEYKDEKKRSFLKDSKRKEKNGRQICMQICFIQFNFVSLALSLSLSSLWKPTSPNHIIHHCLRAVMVVGRQILSSRGKLAVSGNCWLCQRRWRIQKKGKLKSVCTQQHYFKAHNLIKNHNCNAATASMCGRASRFQRCPLQSTTSFVSIVLYNIFVLFIFVHHIFLQTIQVVCKIRHFFAWQLALLIVGQRSEKAQNSQ